MKRINFVMSVSAVLIVAVNVHALPPVPSIKQTITIKNEAKGTIYGGVYLTNAAGKIYNTQAPVKELTVGQCVIDNAIVKKQTRNNRLFSYHRIIFSYDPEAMKAKIESDNNSNVFSTIIKQFSKGKELYYSVRQGKSLIMRKDNLTIKRVGEFPCNGGSIEMNSLSQVPAGLVEEAEPTQVSMHTSLQDQELARIRAARKKATAAPVDANDVDRAIAIARTARLAAEESGSIEQESPRTSTTTDKPLRYAYEFSPSTESDEYTYLPRTDLL